MTKISKGFPNYQLKNERNQRNWSQQELADQIGTTFTNISRWERGIATPGPFFRTRLCKLFDKKIEDLGLCTRSPQISMPKIENIYLNSFVEHFSSRKKPSIGHDTLRQLLKQTICDEENINTFALYGLPGIGKTALMFDLINDDEVQRQFGGNILWITLGPEPDNYRLLSIWGNIFYIGIDEPAKPRSVQEWVITLHDHLKKCRILLVIDDVWQLEDAVTFKLGGPLCKYLITTRSPKIAFQFAEKVFKVSELSIKSSVQLLEDLFPHPNELKYYPSMLAEIVKGHPLTLTIIGKHLYNLSQYSQPRRVQQTIDQLCTDAKTRMELEQLLPSLERFSHLPLNISLSTQSSIEMSERQLDKLTQGAFYLLSVFPAKPHTFSEEAALAVTAAPPSVLDKLSDIGLLESSEPGRYCIHQVILDYASIYLKDEQVYDRLILYCISFIEKNTANSQMIDKESNVILTALRHAEKLGRNQEKERLAHALAPILL